MVAVAVTSASPSPGVLLSLTGVLVLLGEGLRRTLGWGIKAGRVCPVSPSEIVFGSPYHSWHASVQHMPLCYREGAAAAAALHGWPRLEKCEEASSAREMCAVVMATDLREHSAPIDSHAFTSCMLCFYSSLGVFHGND